MTRNMFAYGTILLTVALVAVGIAIYSWLVGVSAQQVQYTTCEMTLADQDFDLRSTRKAPIMSDEFLTTHTIEARVSNYDYHLNFTQGSDTMEVMKVGDEAYVKAPGGSWERAGNRMILDLYYLYSLINTKPYYTQTEQDYILCVEEGTNAARIGQFKITKTLGAEFFVGFQPEKTFTDWSAAGAAAYPSTQATWEYWTGSDGKITKSKQTFVVSGGDTWDRMDIETTISNVGVENVITAPTVG